MTMGTGWRFQTKGVRRPKKNACDKRRREKVHRKRLVALGLPERKVKKMGPVEMRELLREPKKLLKKKKV
jgi:hypothetical protein